MAEVIMNSESMDASSASHEAKDKDNSQPRFIGDHTTKRKYSSTRHRHPSYRRHWSQRSRMLLVVLIVLLIIDFFSFLFFGIRLYSLNKENAELQFSLKRSERELQQLRPQVEDLRIALTDIVQNRLPHLKKIEYDKVIPLDRFYLKNILFTKLKNQQFHGYEYKLVMHNDMLLAVWPELKINFFDEYGVQLGVAKMGGEDTGTNIYVSTEKLNPGEVRSYSAKLPLEEEGKFPVYFMMRLKGEAELSNTILHKIQEDDLVQ